MEQLQNATRVDLVWDRYLAKSIKERIEKTYFLFSLRGYPMLRSQKARLVSLHQVSIDYIQLQ